MSGISSFDLQLKYLEGAKKIYTVCNREGVKLLHYGPVAIYNTVKENKTAVDLLRLYRRNCVRDFIVKPRDKFGEVIYSLDVAVKVCYDEMMFSHVIPINWNSEFTFGKLLLSKLQMHFPTNKDLSLIHI